MRQREPIAMETIVSAHTPQSGRAHVYSIAFLPFETQNQQQCVSLCTPPGVCVMQREITQQAVIVGLRPVNWPCSLVEQYSIQILDEECAEYAISQLISRSSAHQRHGAYR